MNDVQKLASLLHDKWRETRKKEDGSYESRWKITKDKDWTGKYGTDQVDIANTEYKHLPKDWQGENKASAEVAVVLVKEAGEEGRVLDIEEAAAFIHEKWLERNGAWAPPEQTKAYDALLEADKEKDRNIILSAMNLQKNK